jgi:hypothetical protein
MSHQATGGGATAVSELRETVEKQIVGIKTLNHHLLRNGIFICCWGDYFLMVHG